MTRSRKKMGAAASAPAASSSAEARLAHRGEVGILPQARPRHRRPETGQDAHQGAVIRQVRRAPGPAEAAQPARAVGRQEQHHVLRAKDLVGRPGDERLQPVQLEHRGHLVRERLERALGVVAVPEEEAVDEPPHPAVDRVHEEHHGERDPGGGHHGRDIQMHAREEEIEAGQEPDIDERHQARHHRVDRSHADHRADVEELVAHDGVGHGGREDEVELPHEVQVRHGDAGDDLRGGAEERQHVADPHAPQQHPGAAPGGERRAREHRPSERGDQRERGEPAIARDDLADRRGEAREVDEDPCREPGGDGIRQRDDPGPPVHQHSGARGTSAPGAARGPA